jgi:hypothetical protein
MEVIDVDFLEHVWVDYSEPYFEVASDPSRRFVGDLQSALDRIEQGHVRYYGPVARASRGSKKGDVASSSNLLWLDTDTPGGLDRIEGLRRYGLKPSAVVDTGGRGHHAYFKLSRGLPIESIEAYNKLLSAATGADPSVWNRGRLLRLPGHPHTTTGRPCRVVQLCGHVVDPEDLDVLGHPSRAAPRIDLARGRQQTTSRDKVWLPFALRRYVRLGELPARYASRSEAEAAAVVCYAIAGWSDDEIVFQAFQDGWPKTVEEAERTPYAPERWIRRTITTQRDWLLFDYERHLLTSCDGGIPQRAKRLLSDYEWLTRMPPDGQSVEPYQEALSRLLPGAKPKRDAARLVARMESEGMITVTGDRVTSDLIEDNDPS